MTVKGRWRHHLPLFLATYVALPDLCSSPECSGNWREIPECFVTGASRIWIAKGGVCVGEKEHYVTCGWRLLAKLVKWKCAVFLLHSWLSSANCFLMRQEYFQFMAQGSVFSLLWGPFWSNPPLSLCLHYITAVVSLAFQCSGRGTELTMLEGIKVSWEMVEEWF